MSERILRALVQLFAIIARVDKNGSLSEGANSASNSGRKIVEEYLSTELSTKSVEVYLNKFDEDLHLFQLSSDKKDGSKKRTAVNSVRILKICAQINKELTQGQKIIVLVRILEFIETSRNKTIQEQDFVQTVADSFNIDSSTFNRIQKFVESKKDDRIEDQNLLYISDTDQSFEESKFMRLTNLDSEIHIFRIDSVNILLFKYFGKNQLFLNGQAITNNRIQLFSNGASLKTTISAQLYYSDVISTFLSDKDQKRLDFKIFDLGYSFPNGKIGLYPVSFTAETGQLIGIMGGSGSGKSTLLNILNGNLKPTQGSVEINGINLHLDPENLEGVIGYISQSDVLFEDLSVFQNLYYNAELCFNNLSNFEILSKVVKVLQDVGLYEIRNLKVGSISEKVISGGQRKRLNIALELIREPTVLFVDEPTSGLSSRDSEMIMDLLKELTLKGKLIFVVIHQPSSEIYKMFDRLFLIDTGGYPIFLGNPIDAIVYFKLHVNHVNSDTRECSECGNVNPEQIFNIVEAKVVDEYGNLTNFRKTEGKEWYSKFLSDQQRIEQVNAPLERKRIKEEAKKPHAFKQFKVFFLRDWFSKLSNQQYLLVNSLEAPFLALILAFFLKYYGKTNSESEFVYSFFYNENVTQYIFISIIVAFFMGLTVSAEEIFRDREILIREKFLNLSKTSYLFSKLGILFFVSAVQTLTFVLVGNWIMEIKGMWIDYWMILFTTSCLANVLGLIISSAFNSVKVIYIVIPLLIIPQMLFSGLIVRFDKLNPLVSKENSVPWIGNAMASRWAYEALSVAQFKNNPIEEELFDLKIEKSQSAWKRDYWVPEMKEKLAIVKNPDLSSKQRNDALTILKNEVNKEQFVWENLKCDNCFSKEELEGNLLNLQTYLLRIREQYIRNYDRSSQELEKSIAKIGEDTYNAFKMNYDNENLISLLTNRKEYMKLKYSNGEMIQKVDPIYQVSIRNGFFDNQLYTPYKNIFGITVSTYFANLVYLWLMILVFFLILYFDIAKNILMRFKLLIKIK